MYWLSQTEDLDRLGFALMSAAMAALQQQQALLEPLIAIADKCHKQIVKAPVTMKDKLKSEGWKNLRADAVERLVPSLLGYLQLASFNMRNDALPRQLANPPEEVNNLWTCKLGEPAAEPLREDDVNVGLLPQKFGDSPPSAISISLKQAQSSTWAFNPQTFSSPQPWMLHSMSCQSSSYFGVQHPGIPQPTGQSSQYLSPGTVRSRDQRGSPSSASSAGSPVKKILYSGSGRPPAMQ